MKTPFVKMHGNGNDFVIIDNIKQKFKKDIALIKKITNRNKRLDVANSRIDRWIDNIASKLRARSGKTKEFFDIERTNIGERASDANKARVLSRDLDKQIDKLFPAFRTIAVSYTHLTLPTILRV